MLRVAKVDVRPMDGLVDGQMDRWIEEWILVKYLDTCPSGSRKTVADSIAWAHMRNAVRGSGVTMQ